MSGILLPSLVTQAHFLFPHPYPEKELGHLHICFLQSTGRTFSIFFEFTLLSTIFDIKILTETVGGFYTSPVLATYYLCY